MYKVGDMIMISNGETDTEHYGFIIGIEPMELFDDLDDDENSDYCKIQWFDGIISYENDSNIIKVS